MALVSIKIPLQKQTKCEIKTNECLNTSIQTYICIFYSLVALIVMLKVTNSIFAYYWNGNFHYKFIIFICIWIYTWNEKIKSYTASRKYKYWIAEKVKEKIAIKF